MTEEEMRAKITEQEEYISNITNERDTYKEQIETKEKEITSLHDTVSELKQKNYDLFVKVQTPVEDIIDKPQVKIPTMEEVISKLKGGN